MRFKVLGPLGVMQGDELVALGGPKQRMVLPSKPMRIWFGDDGSRLIVVYEDGRILVYPIALSEAIEIAQSRVTRSLTPDECQRYHVSSCSPGS